MSDTTIPGLSWEGFLLKSATLLNDSGCLVSLTPDPQHSPRCSGCGLHCHRVHDVSRRRIRDRDLFEYRVWVEVPVRRVHCEHCGVGREALNWLDPRARITVRLRMQIEVLLRLLPIKHVAELTGLHWHTLKAIDKARLARDLSPPDLSRVRFLVMDEFALFKGHRYASVVMDAERTQMLWIGEGRSRQAIRPFFKWLGRHCEQIEAVAMDMNTAMDLEVQTHCPQARIVYDLFHVIAKFGREVIDRVRVDQANLLRHDKPARRVIKDARWLLLRNPENLKGPQQASLEELLAANQPIMTTYLLKAQLRELWYAPNESAARWRWNSWLTQALNSGIEALARFAHNLLNRIQY